MTSTLRYYKELYKNINRLPLDQKSLELAKKKIKKTFRDGKQLPNCPIDDPKRWRKAIDITSSLLQGDYKELPNVLDLIYKDSTPQGPWIHQFLETKYSAFKDVWPQVHLLHEFGKEKHINSYNQELSKQTVGEFSLMKEMNLKLQPDEIPLQPLRKAEAGSSLNDLISKMKAFHTFVSRHSDTLLSGRPKPFEIIYEPTRFGLPKSVAARERDIKFKVNYMKEILKQVQPIPKDLAQHLCKVATSTSSELDIVLNSNFFRYMSRTHASRNDVSPFERKYLRQKQLVPNERNIRFCIKDWAAKQVYEDENGTLKLNSIKYA